MQFNVTKMEITASQNGLPTFEHPNPTLANFEQLIVDIEKLNNDIKNRDDPLAKQFQSAMVSLNTKAKSTQKVLMDLYCNLAEAPNSSGLSLFCLDSESTRLSLESIPFKTSDLGSSTEDENSDTNSEIIWMDDVLENNDDDGPCSSTSQVITSKNQEFSHQSPYHHIHQRTRNASRFRGPILCKLTKNAKNFPKKKATNHDELLQQHPECILVETKENNNIFNEFLNRTSSVTSIKINNPKIIRRPPRNEPPQPGLLTQMFWMCAGLNW